MLHPRWLHPLLSGIWFRIRSCCTDCTTKSYWCPKCETSAKATWTAWHSCWLLALFMQVGDVLEELKHSINGNPGSQVQKLSTWTNNLPVSILTKSWQIQRSVAEAAYMMSDYWAPDQGTCKCGAILTLRFGWKVSPISYPSCFGGMCSIWSAWYWKTWSDKITPCYTVGISRSLEAMTDKEIKVLRN